MQLLGPSDIDAMLELAARDPGVNVFADYRARLTELDPRWLGGETRGIHRRPHLVQRHLPGPGMSCHRRNKQMNEMSWLC
ncbi:MAG: hypothetical protein ACRDVZ_11480 [Jiangellaceae bacterium]